jgi:hypothetical protein
MLAIMVMRMADVFSKDTTRTHTLHTHFTHRASFGFKSRNRTRRSSTLDSQRSSVISNTQSTVDPRVEIVVSADTRSGSLRPQAEVVEVLHLLAGHQINLRLPPLDELGPAGGREGAGGCEAAVVAKSGLCGRWSVCARVPEEPQGTQTQPNDGANKRCIDLEKAS